MLYLALLACQPDTPQIEVWAKIEGNAATVQWIECTIRPKSTDWFDSWEQLELSAESHNFEPDEEILIASGPLPEQRYIHTFPDAQSISSMDQDIVDIIEPVATPVTLDGAYRIDIDFIIMQDPNGDQAIFVKDANVSPL